MGAFKRLTDDQFHDKMKARALTPDGREIPDPKPVRPSVKVTRTPSMFDIHRETVQREIEYRRMMESESEDDLQDFGPDDDEDVIERLSEYEQADLELTLREEEKRAAATRQSTTTNSAPAQPAPPQPVQEPAQPAPQPAPGAAQAPA